MTSLVKLLINDDEVFQYDKNIELPESQRNYLHLMDSKMNGGINLDGNAVNNPSQLEKAQFVIFNLLSYLDKNEEQESLAMFSYIVHYLDELKQVKVQGKTGNYKIEFVFYKDLSQWSEIKFH